jgi:predicted ATPase
MGLCQLGLNIFWGCDVAPYNPFVLTKRPGTALLLCESFKFATLPKAIGTQIWQLTGFVNGTYAWRASTKFRSLYCVSKQILRQYRQEEQHKLLFIRSVCDEFAILLLLKSHMKLQAKLVTTFSRACIKALPVMLQPSPQLLNGYNGFITISIVKNSPGRSDQC